MGMKKPSVPSPRSGGSSNTYGTLKSGRDSSNLCGTIGGSKSSNTPSCATNNCKDIPYNGKRDQGKNGPPSSTGPQSGK